MENEWYLKNNDSCVVRECTAYVMMCIHVFVYWFGTSVHVDFSLFRMIAQFTIHTKLGFGATEIKVDLDTVYCGNAPPYPTIARYGHPYKLDRESVKTTLNQAVQLQKGLRMRLLSYMTNEDPRYTVEDVSEMCGLKS